MLFGVVVLFGGCLGGVTDGPGEVIQVSFASVQVGGAHSCGLTALGEAFCWGANGQGQLGNGELFDVATPSPVFQGTLTFRNLSAGSAHTCAITSDSLAYCWGSNSLGQLGVGSSSVPLAAPEQVVGGLKFKQISSGGSHTCGLAADGVLYCWGLEEGGRLGNGQSTSGQVRPSPDTVFGGLRFSEVSAGGGHTCAIELDQRTFCWGTGVFGQIGNGATGSVVEPTEVSGGLTFATVTAGGKHTCALTLDGAAYCWGEAGSAQLGIGSLNDKDVPAQVAGGIVFTKISAGGSYTCAVSGDAFCWGLNQSGEVGDGTTQVRLEPTEVLFGGNFTVVAAGKASSGNVSCGFSDAQVVWCWGFGALGQLGTGSGDNALVPVPVAGQGF